MRTYDVLIYLIPVITGMVGWLTNWLAVQVLFKPKKPVKILFFTLQGSFPKKQQRLAEKIGDMMSDELSIVDDIKGRVLEDGNLDTFIRFIEEKIDYYLDTEFPTKYPVTSVFFGKTRRKQIKADLLAEIHQRAPEIMEKIMKELDEKIEMNEMIAEKVSALSPDKVEKLLNNTFKKEFIFIGVGGGVLGFIIGLVHVLLIQLFK